MIRWGMVGCGDVTEVKSAPAYSIPLRSALVGVTSRTISKAHDYAARHNIEHVFDSAAALINSEHIDAVYIATPPASHVQLALLAAEARKPCCIEKPIAINYAGARQITDAFAASNTPVFIAYYRRTLPQFETVRSWIEAGRIGKVRHVHWGLHRAPTPDDLNKIPAWRTQPQHAPGGYFDDLACHGLDLFDHFFGPIKHAAGQARNELKLYDVPDSVTGHWVHENGITGSGFWNFTSVNGPDQVEIIGEQGKIFFSVFGDTPLMCETKSGTETLKIENPKHVQEFHAKRIMDHLEGLSAHPSLGESAARCAWVCDRILGKSL